MPYENDDFEELGFALKQRLDSWKWVLTTNPVITEEKEAKIQKECSLFAHSNEETAECLGLANSILDILIQKASVYKIRELLEIRWRNCAPNESSLLPKKISLMDEPIAKLHFEHADRAYSRVSPVHPERLRCLLHVIEKYTKTKLSREHFLRELLLRTDTKEDEWKFFTYAERTEATVLIQKMRNKYFEVLASHLIAFVAILLYYFTCVDDLHALFGLTIWLSTHYIVMTYFREVYLTDNDSWVAVVCRNFSDILTSFVLVTGAHQFLKCCGFVLRNYWHSPLCATASLVASYLIGLWQSSPQKLKTFRSTDMLVIYAIFCTDIDNSTQITKEAQKELSSALGAICGYSFAVLDIRFRHPLLFVFAIVTQDFTVITFLTEAAIFLFTLPHGRRCALRRHFWEKMIATIVPVYALEWCIMTLLGLILKENILFFI